MQSLTSLLSPAGIVLIAADELEHETLQPDRGQRGLPPGQVPRVQAIAMAVTNPACAYVRLHRRHGTLERLLPEDEQQASGTALFFHCKCGLLFSCNVVDPLMASLVCC